EPPCRLCRDHEIDRLSRLHALLRAVSFDPGATKTVSVGPHAGQLPVGCPRLAVLRYDQFGCAWDARLRLSRQHTPAHGPREPDRSEAKSYDVDEITPTSRRPTFASDLTRCAHRGYDLRTEFPGYPDAQLIHQPPRRAHIRSM